MELTAKRTPMKEVRRLLFIMEGTNGGGGMRWESNKRMLIMGRESCRLAINDIPRKEIEVLGCGEMDSDLHTANWDANGFPSDVYIARLVAENSLARTNSILFR